MAAPRGRVVVIVALVSVLVGAVLGAAVVGVLAGQSTGDGAAQASATPEPGSIESIAAELAEGQRQESADLAEELASAGEVAHDLLGDVLVGLAAVVPPDDGSGATDLDAGAQADVEEWISALDQAEDALSATGQGNDDQAVTRAAFLGSVALLRSAVEDVAAAQASEPGRQQDLLADVGRDRLEAVSLWQAGGARLDSLVLETGGDHIHLFLDPSGDPDAVPEEFQNHADD
ncbi:hypothetical protein ACNI3K_06795 [Demequina sp. SO4-13]|uniref:hypothetical protein n=1 Tax=Demequina sp. SO4-13 TaxID=3401027 RepID=UPI003AF8EC42